jgi:hypothetical protein
VKRHVKVHVERQFKGSSEKTSKYRLHVKRHVKVHVERHVMASS